MRKKQISILFSTLCLLSIVFLAPFSVHAQGQTLRNHTELENASLTTISGQCSPGVEPSRVVFYCNESGRTHQNSGVSPIPGKYRIDVSGNSSNTSPAGIAITLSGQPLGVLTWNNTTPTTQSLTFDVTAGSTTKEVSFILTTDNGSSDTVIDWYELYYLGPASTPRPSSSPSSTGAFFSGIYRNMFAESGYTQNQINEKLNIAWNQLFHGVNDGNKTNPQNQSIYTEVGTDMAYIDDVNDNDIRSEGMSYGMMIAVQLNKKQEFDRLWKFAKTYMKCPRSNQCPSGSGKDGYFSWQVSKNLPYSAIDENPAPDGEEYFATALLFASSRWGNAGELNYKADAQNILDAMINSSRANGISPMFNMTNKLIIFSPIGQSATMTDPSYHLPAFYEFWARTDTNVTNRAFWQTAAAASRSFWKNASGHNQGRENGLMPDCTNFSGEAIYGCAGGAIYSYDSWRTIANVAVDYAWWAADPWEITEADRFQNFFGPKRPSYSNQWNMNGTPASNITNSTGQIAMNAVASLAGTNQYVWSFVDDAWNLPIPTGQYRYYDGMLYLMSLLHLSGNFRIYSENSVQPTPVPKQGDANGDTIIDGVDYVVWLNHYNQSTTRGHLDGDFNISGKVDGIDYVVWLNSYGK
jgi:endo-1,4-beta-D-glucanase Y